MEFGSTSVEGYTRVFMKEYLTIIQEILIFVPAYKHVNNMVHPHMQYYRDIQPTNPMPSNTYLYINPTLTHFFKLSPHPH